MDTLPHIHLVPGAFHSRSAMDLLSNELTKAGYSTSTSEQVTVDNPRLTIKDDAAALDEVLYTLIEQEGKDIVLYLHSYAGFPGSAAIKGYAKIERLGAGKLGGIIGLIYQSAFIPTQGVTLLQMIGGHPPWQDPNVTRTP